MENVLFKISFPAEFHAQTAVECAMELHPQVADKLDQIDRIVIETQEAGVRIIDKTGPLANYADRDHCLQYMVAVPLIFGRLTADDYTDDVAADPRIDALRGQDGGQGEPALHPGLLRPGEALHRQFGARSSSRTAAPPARSPSTTRSATASAVARASRCCCRSSRRRIGGQLPARRVEQILALTQDTSRFEATPIHRLC